MGLEFLRGITIKNMYPRQGGTDIKWNSSLLKMAWSKASSKPYLQVDKANKLKNISWSNMRFSQQKFI